MRLDIRIEGHVQTAMHCAITPYPGWRAGLFLFRRSEYRPSLIAVEPDQDDIARCGCIPFRRGRRGNCVDAVSRCRHAWGTPRNNGRLGRQPRPGDWGRRLRGLHGVAGGWPRRAIIGQWPFRCIAASEHTHKSQQTGSGERPIPGGRHV